MEKNKQSIQKYTGFTLIETLITLGLICLLFFLPAISLDGLYQQYRIHFFFSQFEKKMAFAQQAAIISGRKATVYVHDQQCDFFYQWYQNVQRIEELMFPPEIESGVKEVSLNFKAGKGNVDKLPKFIFIDKKNQKKYVYQINLGSGKYEKKVEDLT